eukprot:6293410-Amphidinium_carterae.1
MEQYNHFLFDFLTAAYTDGKDLLTSFADAKAAMDSMHLTQVARENANSVALFLAKPQTVVLELVTCEEEKQKASRVDTNSWTAWCLDKSSIIVHTLSLEEALQQTPRLQDVPFLVIAGTLPRDKLEDKEALASVLAKRVLVVFAGQTRSLAERVAAINCTAIPWPCDVISM